MWGRRSRRRWSGGRGGGGGGGGGGDGRLCGGGGGGAGTTHGTCTRASVARWPDATMTQSVTNRRVPKNSRFTTFCSLPSPLLCAAPLAAGALAALCSSRVSSPASVSDPVSACFNGFRLRSEGAIGPGVRREGRGGVWPLLGRPCEGAVLAMFNVHGCEVGHLLLLNSIQTSPAQRPPAKLCLNAPWLRRLWSARCA